MSQEYLFSRYCENPRFADQPRTREQRLLLRSYELTVVLYYDASDESGDVRLAQVAYQCPGCECVERSNITQDELAKLEAVPDPQYEHIEFQRETIATDRTGSLSELEIISFRTDLNDEAYVAQELGKLAAINEA